MDREGRYIFIKGQVQDKEQMQCEFFSELDRVMSRLAEDGYRILIGGDFNVIMNMALDYLVPEQWQKLRVGMC